MHQRAEAERQRPIFDITPIPAPDESSPEALEQLFVAAANEPALESGSLKDRFSESLLKSLLTAISPAIFTALGAWLGSRNGRAVSMKIGDIEVKAQTREEVEQLFARAQEIQQEIQQPKIIQP